MDSTGTVQTSYSFEPFGNTTTTGSATTNGFAYTGRELDSTGLYYYRARYYNPSLQRFISEDPIGFRGGINNYVYAGNRPIGRSDPSGLLDVYIWNYQGSAVAWGHAALVLDDGTNISWWPGQDRDYTFGTDKIPIYSAPAIPNQTVQDAADLEERAADEVIHIDGLNEAAIKAWWENFRNNPNNKWSTFGRNCSTVVYDALRAGGGPLEFHPIIWTPANVLDYARGFTPDLNSPSQLTPYGQPW